MGKGTNNRYAILVVGIITLLFYGILYAWSVFIPPLEDEFGWDRSQTSLVFSVSMIGLSLGMLSAGVFSKKLKLRHVFLMGGALVICGLNLCRLVTQLWQLYVFYGVFCGYGVGLAYTSWTTNTLAWFGDKVGVASGLLVMGFGMGSVVLGELITLLIYSPLGWRWAFTIIGIIVLLWSLCAAPFMKDPPAQIAQLKPKHDNVGLDTTAAQTAKSPAFWTFCLWRSVFMGSVAAIIAQATVVITGIGGSIAFATMAVAALSLGNGLGRPVGGLVYDHIGQYRSLILFPALGFAISLAMIPFYFRGAYTVFTVLLLAEGLVYGMYSAMNTSYIRTTFGQRHLAINTGISAIVLAPFNLLFPLIAASIFNATGSYDAFFAILPICAVISLACGILTKPAIARLVKRHAPDAGSEPGNDIEGASHRGN